MDAFVSSAMEYAASSHSTNQHKLAHQTYDTFHPGWDVEKLSLRPCIITGTLSSPVNTLLKYYRCTNSDALEKRVLA